MFTCFVFVNEAIQTFSIGPGSLTVFREPRDLRARLTETTTLELNPLGALLHTFLLYLSNSNQFNRVFCNASFQLVKQFHSLSYLISWLAFLVIPDWTPGKGKQT